MKLNGKIQIVGGNPGENKVLTCTNGEGQCEWLEIPNSGDDIFLETAKLIDNTLILTKVNGDVINVDLSSISSSDTPGEDGVGVTNTVNNGDGTFTIYYSNDTSFTSSDLTGSQGSDGKNGEPGEPGEPGKNGTNGINGVGVTNTVNNGDGTFTIYYSDDSTFTSSDLTGPQGNAGNSSDTFLSSASLQGNDLMLGLNSGTDLSVDLSSLNTDDIHLSSSQLIDSGTSRCLGKNLRLTMSDGTNIYVDVNDLFTDNYVKNLEFDESTNILRLFHWDNREGCSKAPQVEVDLSSLAGGGLGSDKYLNSATLPVDTNHPNANQLTLEMKDGTQYIVDMSGFRNNSNTAHRDTTLVTTTTFNETVTVTHTLNRFYPVFTVYHINRGKVILPEAVGMVNSTGMIPANQVTGPHQLDQIDMTFAEAGTYLISFVG